MDALLLWRQMNRRWQQDLDGTPIPNANEEYLLYQSLVGTWPLEPMDDAQREEYIQRITNYMEKALREAKLHTSWMNPSEDYETAVMDFVRRILSPEAAAFQTDLSQFVAGIADAGFVNALAQVLLKATLPGVPDFYQGTELWDFSLVDPDNRRPVDFAARRASAEQLEHEGREDPQAAARNVAAQWPDPRAKLLVTMKALSLRHRWPDVFSNGQYTPLVISGAMADHVFAFARHHDSRWAVVATPRHFYQLAHQGGSHNSVTPTVHSPRADWGDTRLLLPDDAGRIWHEEISGRVLEAAIESDTLAVRAADLFEVLPVALLTASKD
jgi:(1->4)-alpha-D-glucan 1-alpha-D-glucosylmutase